MAEFRSGSLRVLVATDLAARGIDVDGVSHVYNYELPEVAETYVHRIGRTARAGASGVAVALCDSEEKPLLRAIEKLLRKSVPVASGGAFEKAAVEGRKAAAAEAAARKADPASFRREPEYVDPRARQQRRSSGGRTPSAARGSGSRRPSTSGTSSVSLYGKESGHGIRIDRKPGGHASSGGLSSHGRGEGTRSRQRGF
jgi:ATP-dependent RNA helicase RhlE